MSTKPRIRVPARSVPSGVYAPPTVRSGYMRDERGPVFGHAWMPALREPRDDVRVGWYAAAARAVDMAQNSGWFAGMLEQCVANIVGNGLRLKSKPDTDMLRWDSKQASDWARTVERKFELTAKSAIEVDAEAKKTLGHLQAVAIRHWLQTGDILAALPTFKREGSNTLTKIWLLPPTRLLNKNEPPFTVQGVQLDNYGAAMGYWLRNPTALDPFREEFFRSRDEKGRLNVLHVFDGMAGQARGISPMTPALRLLRQLSRLGEYKEGQELSAAAFAATVESEAPTMEVLKALQTTKEQQQYGRGHRASMDPWFDAREGWYQGTDIDLGRYGKFAHMYPGEKLKFHGGTGTTSYEAFCKFLLREIARAAGMTYESATGDYSNATYSSVRMATTDMFGITTYRRQNIVGPFSQGYFESWLEEKIEVGEIEIPGGPDAFQYLKPALCRAEWRGAGKPQADDLKAAKAHEIWRRLGVMTDEMIANELGCDIEDVYEIREREKKMRAEYHLPDPEAPAPGNDDPDIEDEKEAA